ncbi:MAG: hypothetical protein GX591_20575 [Planctomycetes bacterium]|nr:hypothetical protein [Planctomycetota bacterium]
MRRIAPCAVIVLLAALAVSLCGCRGLVAALDNPTEAVPPRPGLRQAPLDADADGVAEAMVWVDAASGAPLIEPATGLPVEVPGSRDALARAGTVDSGLADLLAAIGISIPLAGSIGALIARHKPMRLLSGLVQSVQAVREDVAQSPDALARVDAVLAFSNSQVAGLNKAIARAKASIDDLDARAAATAAKVPAVPAAPAAAAG